MSSARIVFVMQIWRRSKIPLNAIVVSLVLVLLVVLINLGSTTALNAINSVTICALLSSYILTISCLLWQRLSGEVLPARRWSLGRFGTAINIASLIFLLPMFAFAFFPLATPVHPATMNWGVLMFGGVVLFATLYYFVLGRKHYVPPVMLVKHDRYEI
jgi:amino acid transporter